MLSLRDPADETNDLGRKGIAIKHVQVTFRDLSFQLEFDMRVNARPSILGPLVGTSYMHDYARRGKLREHGQKLLQRMQKSLSAKAKAIREAEKLKAEEEEMLRQIEEEQKRHLLAKEQWDKEQQKEADERNERSRMEAQKASVLEHGEAMASILGMPSVEEEEQAREDVAAPGQPTDDSNKA
jgi:non-canonical poly(A) RNA polymerase PAPD5/7